jgi:hypothetical protein
MVEEVVEPMPDEGSPKRSSRSPTAMDGMVEDEESECVPRWEPWLPLYRVQGQGLLQREGSPIKGLRARGRS